MGVGQGNVDDGDVGGPGFDLPKGLVGGWGFTADRDILFDRNGVPHGRSDGRMVVSEKNGGFVVRLCGRGHSGKPFGGQNAKGMVLREGFRTVSPERLGVILQTERERPDGSLLLSNA